MPDQPNNEPVEPKTSATQESGEVVLDAAGKSLTEALRVSFVILKVIMAVLIILFLGSGLFTVGEDENAMVLRFGRIRGMDRQDRVLGPGFGWDFPAPISEIVRIPVTHRQTLRVESFWYYMTENERLQGASRYAGATLNPQQDGYGLIRNDPLAGGEGTDYNIVHCRLSVVYHIADIEPFFQNVYYETPGPGQDFLDVAGRTVDPLLRAMTEDAVVKTLVRYTIDQALTSAGQLGEEVRHVLNAKLEAIQAGIVVDLVNVEQITWPRQVNEAFEESIQAQQTRRELIRDAQIRAEQTLNESGGPQAVMVLEELKRIEAERQAAQEALQTGSGDAEAARASLRDLENQRTVLLSRLSGRSGQMIAEARAYKTQVIKNAQANAQYLESLLGELRDRPALARVVLERIYQEAIEEVLQGVDEKILVQSPADEIRVLVNRDPRIPQEKERQPRPGGPAGAPR